MMYVMEQGYQSSDSPAASERRPDLRLSISQFEFKCIGGFL